MSALSIGIQLELASMNYYREQAEKASNPDVSGFYTELADWETGHYNALLRQQEMLKEDFWAKGGFAPF
jgi:rubrerythrin